MSKTTIEALRELAAKWRDRIGPLRMDDYHVGMRHAYERAADELETALATMEQSNG